LAEGIGGGGFEVSVAAGKRKGSAPLGEAWLFDDEVLNLIPENFK